MKLQGNVKGSVYPVTQQAYDEPIDGMHRCGWRGHKFVAVGSGRHTYCSNACRTEALKEQHRKASARYRERLVMAR